MQFHVYQSPDDPDHYFVIDNDSSTADLPATIKFDTMLDVGVFPEMGESRVAFSEKIAKSAIRARGYYDFTAHGDLVMETPGV